ncbi:MAG: hypothetical protein NTX72_01380 [Candidatus Uhrbacteria bacterium]|nr:hypothetical protein [Candidatus Uhrbacteria bacterium]
MEPVTEDIKIPAPKLIRRLEGRTTVLNHLALSPDEQRLIGAGEDEEVHMWDVATGTILRRLDLHKNEERSASVAKDGIAWSTHGQTVFLADLSGDVISWQESRWFWQKPGRGEWVIKRVQNTTSEHNGYGGTSTNKFTTVAVSSSGFLAAAQNNHIWIFRLTKGSRPKLLHRKKYDGGIRLLTFSPNGNKLAVSIGAKLCILSASESELEQAGPAFKTDNGPIEEIDWLTEDVLVSASDGGKIGIHSNIANNLYDARTDIDHLNTFCLVDAQTLILSIRKNGKDELRIVRLPDMKILYSLKGFQDLRSILLYGNGRFMITSDSHTQDDTGYMKFSPAIYDFGNPNLGRMPIPLIGELPV